MMGGKWEIHGFGPKRNFSALSVWFGPGLLAAGGMAPQIRPDLTRLHDLVRRYGTPVYTGCSFREGSEYSLLYRNASFLAALELDS